MLIAHGRGISQAGAGIGWFEGDAVIVALPDLQGGVVFQRDGDPPGSIEHLRAPGADPTVLVDRSPTDRLAILDVFRLDGTPTLAYTHATRLPNSCPPFDSECAWAHDITYVLLFNLESDVASVNLGAIGSFESDWNGYRFGGNRYASVWAPYGEARACIGWGDVGDLIGGASPDRWLSARDLCRHGPPLDCGSHDDLCAGGVRIGIAADGSSIVYATGGYLLPLQVTVIDFETGTQLHRHVIGSPDEHPTWIESDGAWIFIGRMSPDGSELPSLAVRPDGVVEQVEFTGRVTIWTSGDRS